ncbi:MAG: LysR family transcriptional regulator [Xenophilus sp.]
MRQTLDSPLLGALRCFVPAGRLLSFTKAAKALNLTQSAVSQQIRYLEDRLGHRLFRRESRGLALTGDGLVLLESVGNAFAAIEETLARLNVAEAPLQVSCVPSFAMHWLMPRLAEFQRHHPHISIRLQAEFQAPEGFAQGAEAADISIRYDTLQCEVPGSELLMEEYMLPVASVEYLERHPDFASGQSMDGIVFLHDSSPWVGATSHTEWRLWLEAHRPQWLEKLSGVQYNLSTLAIGAALVHQGVAMARSALVIDEIVSGRLATVFGRPVKSPARYMLLCQNMHDQRTSAFARWLSAECALFSESRSEKLQLA